MPTNLQSTVATKGKYRWTISPLNKTLCICVVSTVLSYIFEAALALKFAVVIIYLSISTVNEEVFLMAVGDTTLSDNMTATVSVMVGFNGVDIITDSVIINFMITAGETIATFLKGKSQLSMKNNYVVVQKLCRLDIRSIAC